jgi:hypothetical protein
MLNTIGGENTIRGGDHKILQPDGYKHCPPVMFEVLAPMSDHQAPIDMGNVSPVLGAQQENFLSLKQANESSTLSSQSPRYPEADIN